MALKRIIFKAKESNEQKKSDKTRPSLSITLPESKYTITVVSGESELEPSHVSYVDEEDSIARYSPAIIRSLEKGYPVSSAASVSKSSSDMSLCEEGGSGRIVLRSSTPSRFYSVSATSLSDAKSDMSLAGSTASNTPSSFFAVSPSSRGSSSNVVEGETAEATVKKEF